MGGVCGLAGLGGLVGVGGLAGIMDQCPLRENLRRGEVRTEKKRVNSRVLGSQGYLVVLSACW